MENQVAIRESKMESLMELFHRPAVQRQLSMAATKHLPPEKVIRVIQTAIRNAPKLMECTPASLLTCLMASATLGLAIEPFLGQAYMVPFRNKRLGNRMEAQFIVGYRGYIALAKRSGEIANINAAMIHQSDYFDLSFGTAPRLEHKPGFGPKKWNDIDDWLGAYVVVNYKGGTFSMEFMTTDEIKYVRDTYSRAADGDAWKMRPTEMAIKTVIRKHLKVVPMTVEMAQAVALDEAASIGESQRASLFELPQVPEIEDDAGAEMAAIEDRPGRPTAEDFDNRVNEEIRAGHVDRNRMNAFVQVVALNSRSNSVDDLKREIMVDGFERFLNQFHYWEKQHPAAKPASGPDPEPKPEPKPAAAASLDAQWEEWWGKVKNQKAGNDKSGHRTGFGQFVRANGDVFARAPESIRAEARKKWLSLYPGAAPPEAIAEAKPAKASPNAQGSTQTAAAAHDMPEAPKGQANEKRPITASETIDLQNEAMRIKGEDPEAFDAVRERLGLPEDPGAWNPTELQSFFENLYDGGGIQF